MCSVSHNMYAVRVTFAQVKPHRKAKTSKDGNDIKLHNGILHKPKLRRNHFN